MDLKLYINKSVHNKLDKDLEVRGTYAAVKLVEGYNDYDIALKTTVNESQVGWDRINYLGFGGAFYFIDSVDYLYDNVQVIKGRLDLLMTYREYIKKLTVLTDRQKSKDGEAARDARAVDDSVITSADMKKSNYSFPMQIDKSEEAGFYALTTAQTGYDYTSGGFGGGGSF